MDVKIPISRVKLSERLLAVTVQVGDGASNFSRICRRLTAEGINIAFAVMDTSQDASSSLCCIDQKDGQRLKTILSSDNELKGIVTYLPQVGVVDLFPHQYRFKVFGLVLEAFANRQIKVHGMASSISALSFVIDFDQLPLCHQVLSNCFQLPAGYDTPYRT